MTTMMKCLVLLFALVACAVAKTEPQISKDVEQDDALRYEPLQTSNDDVPIIPPGTLDINGNEVDSTRFFKMLSVNNGGPWGSWGPASFCPKGSFAAGYGMKIEPKQNGGDDTSLNGIKIICKNKHSNFMGEVDSKVGPWGSWGASVFCREKSDSGSSDYLTTFSLQVEGKQGTWKDDTAANFVKFKCRGLYTSNHDDYVLIAQPKRGFWGDWGAWSQSCPRGTAICGIQTKVEGKQSLGDDTALNDARFFCCKP
ncbi:Vitelline membrane outer layer protein 1 [Mactra antiquata]